MLAGLGGVILGSSTESLRGHVNQLSTRDLFPGGLMARMDIFVDSLPNTVLIRVHVGPAWKMHSPEPNKQARESSSYFGCHLEPGCC